MWSVSRAGRVVLVVLLVAIAAAVFAPQPWSGVGALVAALLFLGAVMESFVGGTVGGYISRTPLPGDERLARMRRMYRGRRRR